MEEKWPRFWKCGECHGTGKTIHGSHVYECGKCDGTGNAMVDGPAEAHKRRLRELEGRP